MAEPHHAVTCQLHSHFPHMLKWMQAAGACLLTATKVSMAELPTATTR